MKKALLSFLEVTSSAHRLANELATRKFFFSKPPENGFVHSAFLKMVK